MKNLCMRPNPVMPRKAYKAFLIHTKPLHTANSGYLKKHARTLRRQPASSKSQSVPARVLEQKTATIVQMQPIQDRTRNRTPNLYSQ